jgi:hypothetical protein
MAIRDDLSEMLKFLIHKSCFGPKFDFIVSPLILTFALLILGKLSSKILSFNY